MRFAYQKGEIVLFQWNVQARYRLLLTASATTASAIRTGSAPLW